MLTDRDRDNIRAFNLRLKTNMSRENYGSMARAFSHKMDLDSLYVTKRRIAVLSGITVEHYDCCINSCVCYTGKLSELDRCPFPTCNEPRFNTNGRPRRQFSYLPLIPRLKAFFQDPAMVEALSYRSAFVHEPDSVCDVFSSSRYREMKTEHVMVDGEELAHCFFSDGRDIALGICTDGFLLFNRNRNGPSATPILIKNYNLPPTIRTHLEHLLCVGVIPGPRQAKDLTSFLAPLDEELAILAAGLPCYDSKAEAMFRLHAYQLTEEGDIIAIEKFLGLKGHSSLCPCRSCEMHGCRMSTGRNRVYYIPLTRPARPYLDGNGVFIERWDPRDLPARTHESFFHALEAIGQATTKRHRRQLEQHYGIKLLPALSRVNSLDYARSCPWEWLHLFAENLIPNLLDIWTGRFKGMDTGTGDYELDPGTWTRIGAETVEATRTIPSQFVRLLGNIAEDRGSYTAESYAFWFMYLAPHLLRNRFQDAKYYEHAMALVKIMQITLQFEFTSAEIDDLEVRCQQWVQDYEK